MGDGTIRLKDDDALDLFLRARHCKVHADSRLVQPAGPTGRWAGHQKAEPAPKPPKPEKPRSEIEARMSQQLHMAGLAAGMLEWPNQLWPITGRDYRVDFAWPDRKFVLEVDGAVHRVKGTFKASFERSYLLMAAGWRVLHVGGDQVRSGEACEWVRVLFEKES